MIEVITEEVIDAPAETVWGAFIDSRNWPEIGGGIFHDSAAGEPFDSGVRRILVIDMPGLPKLKVKPAIIENTGNRLTWRGKVPGFWGEHYFRAEPIEDGARTRFVHGERFGGLLHRPLMLAIRSRLVRGYGAFNQALKQFVERAEGN